MSCFFTSTSHGRKLTTQRRFSSMPTNQSMKRILQLTSFLTYFSRPYCIRLTGLLHFSSNVSVPASPYHMSRVFAIHGTPAPPLPPLVISCHTFLTLLCGWDWERHVFICFLCPSAAVFIRLRPLFHPSLATWFYPAPPDFLARRDFPWSSCVLSGCCSGASRATATDLCRQPSTGLCR